MLPTIPKLIVSDFDGVFTNNKVLINQDGVESVTCDRSDGWGISLLKKASVKFVILSTENNPVVKARSDKLNIACYQGSTDKLKTLFQISKDHDIPLSEIIYLGNDTNDLECLKSVGCGVVVEDSHPDLLAIAKILLQRRGGHGAVRELCDLVLKRLNHEA